MKFNDVDIDVYRYYLIIYHFIKNECNLSYVFLLQQKQMIPIYLLKILYNHFASYAYIIKYNLCQILNKIIKFRKWVCSLIRNYNKVFWNPVGRARKDEAAKDTKFTILG